MPEGPAGRRRRFRVIAAPLLILAATSIGFARENPPEPATPSLPPRIESPPVNAKAAEDETSPRQLLERMRKMEKTIQDLHDQNQELEEKYKHISKELDETRKNGQQRKPARSRSYMDPLPPESVPLGEGEAGQDDESRVRTIEGGGGASRGLDQQGLGNRRLGKLPMNAFYNYGREGVMFSTEDEELSLRIRALVQADARYFLPSNQSPVTDGFYIPRGRIYFDGQITKPIVYELAIQQSFDSLNVLNMFVNFNYDKRFQIRFGRFKTPYTYEFYKILIWNTLAPERSVYNNNFGLNRQVGTMAWGQIFDNRIEYAVGAFDGARNSYQAFKNTPDAIGFVNFKPFEQAAPPARWSFLRDLNFGGSGSWGNENNPLTPAVLRTTATASNATITSTNAVNSANLPFLAFNNNVTEKGARALWELHLAYFERGLSLLGAWDGGYESYAVGSQRPVRVPVGGYFVQAAYLVTGETRTSSGMIDPIRRFDLRPGRFGLGAWEPTARISEVSMGKQVFTGGIADPNLWTNHATIVDVGLNWYLNSFMKVFFDWEYSIFGQPIYDAPGHFSKTNNLFWLRFESLF